MMDLDQEFVKFRQEVRDCLEDLAKQQVALATRQTETLRVVSLLSACLAEHFPKKEEN